MKTARPPGGAEIGGLFVNGVFSVLPRGLLVRRGFCGHDVYCAVLH
jgi:hypothetical protein